MRRTWDVNIIPTLDKSHPSFGCKKAMFQFALTAADGRVARFLLVEANNPAAVICIERILMMDGGRVSDNCRVICVFRDCRNVGTRDDLMNEVPYVDFMQDIVNPDFILNDSITSSAFSQSLSPEEREYVNRKEAEIGQATTVQEAEVPLPEPPVKVSKKERKEVNTPEHVQKLESSLCGMGFRKGDVRKFLDGLDTATLQKPLPDLVRQGIMQLTA